jgi:hypothetical protein
MVPTKGETEFEFHKRCLELYLDLYGDMKAKAFFKVEWNDLWPEDMWGVKLGIVACRIRRGLIHKDKRKELESISFLFEKQTNPNFHGWDKIKLALKTYKVLNGDLLIKALLVVPAEDSQWPSDTCCMKFGSVVARVRRGTLHTDKRDELESISFLFEKQTNPNFYGWDQIKLALETCKALNGDFYGDLLVKYEFIVPTEDAQWLSDIWGMKLGSIVSNIENQNTHADHREDVIAIGIDSAKW